MSEEKQLGLYLDGKLLGIVKPSNSVRIKEYEPEIFTYKGLIDSKHVFESDKNMALITLVEYDYPINTLPLEIGAKFKYIPAQWAHDWKAKFIPA